jgi:predicted GNAT family acetyltransferase
MTTQVIHNSDLNRYEIWLEGEKVGHADYTRMPGELHFVHTEVDPAHQGKNLAGILMQESIDNVRANNMGKIVPVCSYVVMWMQRHPETHDLLLNPIDDAVAAMKACKAGHFGG